MMEDEGGEGVRRLFPSLLPWEPNLGTKKYSFLNIEYIQQLALV